MQLQLSGSTASGAVQRLLSTPAQRTLTFDPTPIGEASPPVHTYLLRNGGPGEVQYKLDLSALKAMAEENWGFEVGVIPAVHCLHMFFQAPLPFPSPLSYHSSVIM